MVLIVHILLATASAVYSTYIAIFPSKNKLRYVYLLTFGTILSGVVLTILKPVHLGKTCIEGSFYLVFMITTLMIVRKRLTVLKT